MGSDKAEKKRLKLEKKRLKAQAKLEKARIEAAADKSEPLPSETVPPQQVIIQAPAQKPAEKVPWYKDPEWVRALVGFASLIVALVAIVLTFY
jgi:hypothetical protein